MAQINEKETSFELVEALLRYIETLQVAGAVLIFLPGWNLIYSMQRHLETNPHFGTSAHTPHHITSHHTNRTLRERSPDLTDKNKTLLSSQILGELTL